jgi:glutaredoxin
MYSIKFISLENCPYSIKAKQLLDNMNINYNYININSNDMDKYITDEIETFPQIYLIKKKSKGNLLLGGYDDLNYSISLFKGQKLDNNNINIFMNKYKWSRKSVLRLIELINNI